MPALRGFPETAMTDGQVVSGGGDRKDLAHRMVLLEH